MKKRLFEADLPILVALLRNQSVFDLSHELIIFKANSANRVELEGDSVKPGVEVQARVSQLTDKLSDEFLYVFSKMGWSKVT